ncbi:hypothetical protein CMK14_10700 [Candidatus Poribacteria bacterium]|nr:hypothetical protein [Candidatus Poribacteria bacterium]
MILVTGAAGQLGQRVVRRLIDKGYHVLGTDRISYENSPSPFVQAELCQAERVKDLVTSAEAVIHLGAIPGPGADGYETFQNNALSTFNIMWAAANQNVPRIVFSSSAFGMGWSDNPSSFVPLYLPLDEEHPMMPFEPYGLSKQIGECIGQMVARSTATSIVSLRFTNVVSPQQQAEFPWDAPTVEMPRTVVMWAYADPRDVAEAHVLGLEADIDGHQAFLLAQPTTRFREPTIDLIEQNFGGRVEIRGSLEGNASVISTAKAQQILGFEPRPGWSQS